MAAKGSSKKQVFDVSHPGTSPPSATSKPVITGSGAVMQDPMVQDKASEPESESEDKKAATSTPKKGLTLQPLHNDIANDASDADATAAEEKTNDTKGSPSEQKTTPEESSEEDTSSASAEPAESETEAAADTEEQKKAEEDIEEPKNAIVDAVIDQTAGGKNSTKKTPDDVDSSIQENIQNKTYFVKISRASNSSTFSVMVIIALLLLIAAVFYVADQRGIITLPF